jgi:hypothetical protein
LPVHTGTSYLDNLLKKAAADGGQGWAAFEKLCEECDRRILGSLFIWLAAPQKIALNSRAKAPQRDRRRKLKTIHFPPIESLEELLYPVSRQELITIVGRARALQRDVERLRRTRLVRSLVLEGTLPDHDLLGGPFIREFRSEAFRGILELPRYVKQYGQRSRPDYTRHLTAVYRHIFLCSGTWHDKEVADILNDLRPHRYQPQTPESLKRWRNAHGLKSRPGRAGRKP